MTTYLCTDCQTRTTTDDDLPVCSGCGYFVFDWEVVPRLAVGDFVKLHHAKSKDRKFGTVVSVGRVNAKIAVDLVSGGTATTTRRLDDPDVKLIFS